MEGDDGRWYESEAAYDEGCKAEMRRILEAEADPGDYDDFIGPVRPYDGPEEIPF